MEEVIIMAKEHSEIGLYRQACDLETRTGVKLYVRTAVASDKALLGSLFKRVTPEDLRHRFLATMKEVGDDQLADLVTGDDPRFVTFLAFTSERTLIACATLCDDVRGETADVALSIHQAWKERGVSWTLLQHVLNYAKAHGLKAVTSFESGDDRTAINLEREMGFVARLSSASPVEITLNKLIEDD